MDGAWTISQLAQEAGSRLAGLGLAQESGRVREAPNARLIRWYTTIGLLDPPLRNGRSALYGRRHLLQLIAVKRRQAQGRPLAEIQAELAGATDHTLENVADVADLTDAPLPTTAPAPAAAPAARRRFWTEPPVPDHDAVHGVRLAPGVTLLLDDAGRTPSAEDRAALAAAAQPLLDELARLMLRGSGPTIKGDS